MILERTYPSLDIELKCYTMDKNPKVVELEKRIADLIIKKLKSQEITAERAQDISRYVLKAVREDMTDDELAQVVPQLDDVYGELAPIVYEELKKFDHAVEEKLRQGIEELIKEGKTEIAAELASRYLGKDLV